MSQWKLLIPRDVQEKMNRKLILEEDVRTAIEAAEHGGVLIEDLAQKQFTTYHRQGSITLWVQYEREVEGVVKLRNVYSHRMVILEKR